jgi:hypothetical protein
LKLIDKAPRGALAILGALALGCLIAACGSASSTSSSSGTTTTASAAAGGAGGTNGTRRAALVACLKQHGVTLPARPPGAPGAPGGAAPGGGTGTGTTGTGTTGTGTTGTGTTGTGTTGTGTAPRRGFFGGGGGFAANPKLRAAFQACGARFGFGAGARGGFRARLSHTAITKYVACVRQHGYNLPNPNFSGKGPVFPANIRSNAKFQAASRACQSILAPPRPSGSGSGSGTSTTAGA